MKKGEDRVNRTPRWAILALGLVASSIAVANTVSSPFSVRINVGSLSGQGGVICTTNVDTSAVPQNGSVNCNPGDGGGGGSGGGGGVEPPAIFRKAPTYYYLQLYRGGQLIGDVNAGTSSGTVTSWRVVRAGNRDYLEIMVGW